MRKALKTIGKVIYLKKNPQQERNSNNKQVIDNLVTAQKFATTVRPVPFLYYSNSKIVTATCYADELKMLGQMVEPSWHVTAKNHGAYVTSGPADAV